MSVRMPMIEESSIKDLPLAYDAVKDIKVSRANQMYYQINYDISTAIFHKRKESGMTYRQFAEYLGVSKTKLYKMESGDYNFRLEDFCRVCDRIGLDIKVLVEKKEDQSEQEVLKGDDICVKY